MAEQDVGAAFQNLAYQLQGVSNKLGAQGVNQIVSTFTGTPLNFVVGSNKLKDVSYSLVCKKIMQKWLHIRLATLQ